MTALPSFLVLTNKGIAAVKAVPVASLPGISACRAAYFNNGIMESVEYRDAQFSELDSAYQHDAQIALTVGYLRPATREEALVYALRAKTL